MQVKIRVGNIIGRKVWLISFLFNNKVKDLIKSQFKARWNPELKCWWINYNEQLPTVLQSNEEIELIISEKIYISKKNIFGDKEDTTLWKYDDKPTKKAKSATNNLIAIEAQNDIAKWRNKLEAKQYAPRSIEAYICAMQLFIVWLSGKNHKEVRRDDIENYMYFLVKERAVSRSYQNLHVNALKLFYAHIMSVHLSPEMIIRPRKEYKLPHYLTREEVSKVFQSTGNLKHRAMISLVYACGLRLGEVIRIKLKDIDPAQRLLMIRQSKGNKDRTVPIPESILYLLNDYATVYKPQVYLFEGQKASESYSERSLQEVFKLAVRKSGIRNQDASLHWLRHSYATHLLEMGTNLRDLQMLLGHKNVKTTEGYTHISKTQFVRIVSPFDVLPEDKSNENATSNTKKLYF